jgi:hypothetical protein
VLQLSLKVVLQALLFEVLEQVDEGTPLDVTLVDVSYYLQSLEEDRGDRIYRAGVWPLWLQDLLLY